MFSGEKLSLVRIAHSSKDTQTNLYLSVCRIGDGAGGFMQIAVASPLSGARLFVLLLLEAFFNFSLKYQLKIQGGGRTASNETDERAAQ